MRHYKTIPLQCTQCGSGYQGRNHQQFNPERVCSARCRTARNRARHNRKRKPQRQQQSPSSLWLTSKAAFDNWIKARLTELFKLYPARGWSVDAVLRWEQTTERDWRIGWCQCAIIEQRERQRQQASLPEPARGYGSTSPTEWSVCES